MQNSAMDGPLEKLAVRLTQPNLGEERTYTCPPESLLAGYSYTCAEGSFGCVPSNLSCCNGASDKLPPCPVRELVAPRFPSIPSTSVTVCLPAPAACALLQYVCQMDPSTELCVEKLTELCPVF
jgi:hypothetical protein